jgi:Icc-related predicted phosphoesterase
MKIHVLSDLHFEFRHFVLPKTDADAVVLAGDIHLGNKGILWAQQHFPDVPVVYILGNHEYYRHAYPKLLHELLHSTQNSNVHVLENQALKIGDVTFLGCTLWTDFALFGDPKLFGQIAMQTMSDYKKIRVSPQFSKLRSVDLVGIHKASRHWLEQQFQARVSEKLVVVTHHAPSLLSVPTQFQTDQFSPAYASSLDAVVQDSRARLWIHGHLHEHKDYTLGQTRVVCNPCGYPDEPEAGFVPDLVLEI